MRSSRTPNPIKIFFVCLLVPFHSLYSQTTPPLYNVERTTEAIKVDANWNKAIWKKTKSTTITNFIRQVPSFKPITEVKLRYDDDNIYVIFRVQDRYVRSITTTPNGPVWKDAAVEFFFCPDTSQPGKYFNLEINCGGTALLGFRSNNPTADDIRAIEIAHSLPEIVDPEITDAVTWTLEYRLPLKMLEKFTNITHPSAGVKWKANFCKIAENNTNPHHMTWSPINAPDPNFHMPQFFGSIVFK